MQYNRRNCQDNNKNKIKKAKIRSIIFIAESFLILILVAALIILGIKYNKLLSKITFDVSSNASDIGNTNSIDGFDSNSQTSSLSAGYTEQQLAMMAEVNNWYLKLVNPDKSIDNDVINGIERSRINSRFTSGSESSKYLDARVVEHFDNMCQAALNDGISLIAVSSYRTYSYQNSLFQNRVKRCENEGYSKEDALKVAATIVAKPGTSEHHLGLAVDINSVEESFENTNAFKWLQKNAANYGFVMRYAKDKQHITKIIYEPWHYRYVGVEHAKAMNQLDMCLEEYVDYLSSGGIKK